jgi:MFS family permease
MDKDHTERDRPKKASFIKIRLIIAILTTLCPVVCYISRQNLPFAIVSMVDEELDKQAGDLHHQDNDVIGGKHSLPDSVLSDDMGMLSDINKTTTFDVNNTTQNASKNGYSPRATTDRPPASSSFDPRDTCPEQVITDESGKVTAVAKTNTYGPKYKWSQQEKGYLLGAFFYTYVIFQIPGARLAEKVGAKWILAAASLGSALLSFIAPWAASVHVHLFSVVRLLMGIFQAALYPACYVLYSKWLPPAERSQGLPILCVGAYVGSIIASALTGYFSEQEHFGWEYSFYVPGVLCLIWSLAWIWFASNEPRDHKYISIEELQSIEMRMEVSSSATGGRRTNGTSIDDGLDTAGFDTTASPAKKDISWYKLFTSQSIWAMMAGFFASNWSFTIVLILLPTYLNNILRVSPMQNGIINSIIYIIYCISSPLVGAGSTMMVETRALGLTRLSIRKLFQGTALFGQAICFTAIALIGCDRTLVFTVLYIQIVFFSLVNGGEVQLPSELSVDFSGTIYAIGNCVGSSTGFIVPYVYSQIVTEPYSRAQWEVYFYTAAVITALGGLIFLIFGQNKMQDFSKDLDDSQMDFVKFGGISATKGGSFNMDSYQNRAHQQQQKQRQEQRVAAAIRSLPPVMQARDTD